ncbi:hypothetical protein [Nocardioides jiangxiensis]|uniref:Uncharacterized protein n=1 Tax=Nocardioides jiangxiensis TaxID=3064524 RepID=A0ABT9B215_9ACTN|nr:hypothetical protein [Nocardioides sp. WY-20]MDO7868733.1 hypothetical protein [Nocardioides sp. WY-20]
MNALRLPKVPTLPKAALPGPVSAALPSPTTVRLAVKVTVAAVPPVIRHGDLRAVKHLPFVLTHLDDAAVVAGAIADPVGSAVRAPGAAARLGVRGAVGGARLGVRGGNAVLRTPGRVLRRR